MKRWYLFCLLFLAVFLLNGCSEQKPAVNTDGITAHAKVITEPDVPPIETENAETSLPESEMEEKALALMINGTALDVQWEENKTVEGLLAFAEKAPIVFNTIVYGGFEQVGSLPQYFTSNDVQITTEPGDIVLYSGNQFVVFFGSNSWSYTKLGHIRLSANELVELLGEDPAVIEVNVN